MAGYLLNLPGCFLCTSQSRKARHLMLVSPAFSGGISQWNLEKVQKDYFTLSPFLFYWSPLPATPLGFSPFIYLTSFLLYTIYPHGSYLLYMHDVVVYTVFYGVTSLLIEAKYKKLLSRGPHINWHYLSATGYVVFSLVKPIVHQLLPWKWKSYYKIKAWRINMCMRLLGQSFQDPLCWPFISSL